MVHRRPNEDWLLQQTSETQSCISRLLSVPYHTVCNLTPAHVRYLSGEGADSSIPFTQSVQLQCAVGNGDSKNQPILRSM
jgi:hypothetical protein